MDDNDNIQNYPFCRLQLVIESLDSLMKQAKFDKKGSKLISQRIRKR